MVSAPTMFPSFLVVVFFVVIFLRHGRNCCVIPRQGVLPRSGDMAIETAGWDEWFLSVPVLFLPLVSTRNSCSGNVALYWQSFRKETVVSGDLPWFLPSHFMLQPVHVNSDAQPRFYGPTWTLGSALNSRASRMTEEGNCWIALLTANFFL